MAAVRQPTAATVDARCHDTQTRTSETLPATHASPFFVHVVGFAPGPVPLTDGSDGGAELQWNNMVESKRKKLKEQDLLENNSQISSVDFFQPRSVSTGLGLSLDNNNRMASSVDSPLLSLIGNDIDLELQRQDAEIDKLLKAQDVICARCARGQGRGNQGQEMELSEMKCMTEELLQGDRLRQAVLEKVQSSQLQTISLVEERVVQKLREKEEEVENINKKNMELEKQMEQLTMEADACQHRGRYNENMITALKFNLQQAYAQSRYSIVRKDVVIVRLMIQLHAAMAEPLIFICPARRTVT
ncbi:hypothetical protein F3Y22_tig00111095pilonHSYRG00924 [Hibiscus syriacus]|uniref:Uncharacterized protein n=1 Tax=Hibiscus syriacus TaxID=106335 RepID=A0A6A2Z1X6_HIBSY|nr:hypothetical protein F3Y22_tig00111095pilonHSYRG00924 [Hibiscus syriacus]